MVSWYVEYKLLIEDKFERGVIDYERYCFLIDKLTQWYHVYSEREWEFRNSRCRGL